MQLISDQPDRVLQMGRLLTRCGAWTARDLTRSSKLSGACPSSVTNSQDGYTRVGAPC